MIAVVDADSCIYQAAWQRETIDDAVENYKYLIEKNWIGPVWADESIVYCGGKNNFRYNLCPEYKANRKEPHSDAKLFKPLMLELVKREMAIPSHGMEADDMVRIKSVELTKEGTEHTVVHIDKDLDCIVGNHYNPRRQEFYDVDEDQADFHYWKQILKGDPTDNLPGLPRVGDKIADKMLSGVPLGRRKHRVLAAYRAKFGIVEWKNKLMETANGIHILRHKDDFFSIERNSND